MYLIFLSIKIIIIISTRNLCQYPLELLFSEVRGIMKFPTAQNFIDCFAVASTKSLIKPPLECNCEEEAVENIPEITSLSA